VRWSRKKNDAREQNLHRSEEHERQVGAEAVRSSDHRFARGDQHIPPLLVAPSELHLFFGVRGRFAYWRQFTTTTLYVIIVVSVELLIGFALAYLLNQKFKAKAVYVTMLAIPMMMSPALVGALWKLIYNPNWGILNWVLGLGELDWIGNPKVNLYGVMIVDVWMWTPFMMLLSVAGLSAIPEYLYEAAEIDRASGWFKFFYITIPLCSPLLMIAVLFRAVEAFKTFDIAMGITGVGAISPQLLSLRLYEKAFYRWDTGLSCAIAYVLLFIVIGMSNIFIRYLNKVRQ
jgi:multiple sugar transport system permease protein